MYIFCLASTRACVYIYMCVCVCIYFPATFIFSWSFFFCFEFLLRFLTAISFLFRKNETKKKCFFNSLFFTCFFINGAMSFSFISFSMCMVCVCAYICLFLLPYLTWTGATLKAYPEWETTSQDKTLNKFDVKLYLLLCQRPTCNSQFFFFSTFSPHVSPHFFLIGFVFLFSFRLFLVYIHFFWFFDVMSNGICLMCSNDDFMVENHGFYRCRLANDREKKRNIFTLKRAKKLITFQFGTKMG